MSSTILIILNVILIAAYIYTRIQVIRKVEKKEIKKKKQLQTKLDYFIHKVEIAKSLQDLYILHKKIWANGIRNENFGPSEYGMFRTDDILTMVPEEIYLGNIWGGLWTKPLPFWETCSIDDQKLVIKQYQNILLSNMKIMKENLAKELAK